MAWRNLVTRPGRFVGALVALAFGVSLIAATGLVLAAAPAARTTSPYAAGTVVVGPVQRIAGTPEQPDGVALPVPAALASEVVTKLAGLPGVAGVVADRYAPVVVLDPSGAPVTPYGVVPAGHGWSGTAVSRYRLAAGRAPAGAQDVVLDVRLAGPAGVALGDTVTVVTPAGPARYEVVGLVAVAASTSVSVSTVVEAPVYFSDERAAGLPGYLAAAVVRPAAGRDAAVLADELRQALPGLLVRVGEWAGTGRGDPVADAYEATASVLGVMAGLSGFVCVFVIAGTFALAVTTRRRELALLRLAGATPGQVRRMVLAEALLLGGLGALAGDALAVPVGYTLVALLRRLKVAPPGIVLGPSPLPLLVAAAIGVVVSLVGVWFAARRTRQVRAVEAMRAASVESRAMTASRWLFGVLGLGGGVAMLWAAGHGTGDDRLALVVNVGMVLVIGAAAVGPVLVPPLVRLASLPLGRLVAVEVAAAHLRAQAPRTAAVAAPVLVLLGIAGSVLTTTASLTASGAVERAGWLRAPLVLLPTAAPGLTGADLAAAAADPGVARVVPVGDTQVVLGTESISATVLPGQSIVDTDAVGYLVRSGRLDDTGDDGFVAAADLARSHHWRVGQRVELRLADGTPARLRLAATVEAGLGLDPLLLPREVVDGHSGDWPVRYALLVARGDTGAAGVGDTPGPRAAVAVPAAAWLERQQAAESEGTRIGLIAIFGLAGLYTAIAIVNTVAMAARERVPELAQLRLAGATTAQALRVLLVEGVLVLLVGTALAALVTGLTAAALPGALGAVSRAARLVVPWPTLGVLTALCAAAVTLAAGVAGRMSLRRPPLAALDIAQ